MELIVIIYQTAPLSDHVIYNPIVNEKRDKFTKYMYMYFGWFTTFTYYILCCNITERPKHRASTCSLLKNMLEDCPWDKLEV